jgi:hypothetical protein
MPAQPGTGSRLNTKLFPLSTSAPASAGANAFERHFKPAELGKLWGLSTNVIRALFEDEAGVLKIVRPEKLHKRRYLSLRIPASVAGRVHTRLDAKRRAA